MTTEQMYINEINKIPRLTKEEEKELFEKVANGDCEAKNKIVESFLYLVVQIARKYFGNGVELADLIQEGTFGLMTAIDKFDVNRGFCFATCASYWIRLSIQRAIQNSGRIVRLPSYILEAIDRINKFTERHLHTFGKEPTEEEIANELHLSVKKVNEYMNIFSNKSVSIDAEMKEDGETTFVEMLEDDSPTPEDIIIKKENAKELLLAISKLSEKERKIISLKFGLVDGREWTFDEISKVFGFTRQNCQLIERDAKKKLKKFLLRGLH